MHWLICVDKIDYIVLWLKMWLKSKHGGNKGGSGWILIFESVVQWIESRILVIASRMVSVDYWLSSSDSIRISMGPWKRDCVLIPWHYDAWWLPGSHLQNSCPIEANGLCATTSERVAHAVPERYEQKRPHCDEFIRRSSQGEGEWCSEDLYGCLAWLYFSWTGKNFVGFLLFMFFGRWLVMMSSRSARCSRRPKLALLQLRTPGRLCTCWSYEDKAAHRSGNGNSWTESLGC